MTAPKPQPTLSPRLHSDQGLADAESRSAKTNHATLSHTAPSR
jgi:hypothetical protein